MHFNRRNFLQVMTQSLLGLTFTKAFAFSKEVAKENSKAKAVIYLNMTGGQSHIDTWDPKPKSEGEGAIGAIRTKQAGLLLGEHLPLTAKIVNDITIVRSMNSKEQSHVRGRYLQQTNYLPRKGIVHPSVGSWILKTRGVKNTNLPGYISINGKTTGSGFLEQTYEPFSIRTKNPLSNITVHERQADRFLERYTLLEKLNTIFNKKRKGHRSGLLR